MVLLHNGGFFNTCTRKLCLHRKMDFKTNALNNAHVSQLLYYKAGLLQNDGIIICLQIKTNSFQMDKKTQNKTWPSCTFHYIKVIQKRLSLQLF
jgi:hypothetical protein